MTENKRFYFDKDGAIMDKEYEFSILGEDELLDIINGLAEENEQLKAQLYCDSDEGICTICKYHYLERGKTYEKYYISKCKKGHEQCSKVDVKYCNDFELKGDIE